MITATMNRALAMVGNPVQDFKKRILRDIEAKKDAMVLALVKRAMDMHVVQRVIANTFDGSTPMCHVLERAVENGIDEHVRDFEVDADNVKGLERYIEQSMEEFEVDAENVKHIDGLIARAVDEALDEAKEELMEQTIEAIIAKLRS